MIRTISRNSQEDSLKNELAVLRKDFVKSGYKFEELSEIELQALDHVKQKVQGRQSSDALVFPLFYFDGLNDFKKVIKEVSEDIQTLIGDTKLIIATKRGRTIGNALVKNKNICMSQDSDLPNQKCNASGCLQCPLVNQSNTLTINGKPLLVQKALNCKSQNIIYAWKCKLCNKEDVYIGRTIQKSHKRTNGHRGCFNSEKWQKSALSMHAMDIHKTNFSLSNFEISIVRKVSPQQIRREEFRLIDKYRTNALGLNRYNVAQ